MDNFDKQKSYLKEQFQKKKQKRKETQNPRRRFFLEGQATKKRSKPRHLPASSGCFGQSPCALSQTHPPNAMDALSCRDAPTWPQRYRVEAAQTCGDLRFSTQFKADRLLSILRFDAPELPHSSRIFLNKVLPIGRAHTTTWFLLHLRHVCVQPLPDQHPVHSHSCQLLLREVCEMGFDLSFSLLFRITSA